MVDRVVLDQRAAPAAPGAETVGQHADDSSKIRPRQVPVGPGAAQQRVELVLVPFPSGGLGDDLLRQHVERPSGDRQPVELTAADAVEQGSAFDQLVARQREKAALRRAVDRVPGAPDTLQEGCDRARRAELADQIDIADVDAELERGGRHQCLQLASLEPLLGVEPLLLGEAAVMRGHLIGAEALGQLTGHPLHQPAGVDKNQGGAVRGDKLGQPVIELLPDLARHHRLERRGWDLEGEIARPAMAGVDDRAFRVRRRVLNVGPRPPADAGPSLPRKRVRHPRESGGPGIQSRVLVAPGPQLSRG